MLRVGDSPSIAVGDIHLSGTVVARHEQRRVEPGSGVSSRVLVSMLIGFDAVAALLAAAVGVMVRFHDEVGSQYRLLVLLLAPLWVAAMAASRAYDTRFLAVGGEEFRHVVNGGIWLFALVASVSYVLHADLSRAAVGVALPLATVLTLAGRLVARAGVHRAVRNGRTLSRMLVIGTRAEVSDLVRHMRRARHAGFTILGVCIDDGEGSIEGPGGSLPVLGRVNQAVAAAQSVHADTIAVAGSAGLAPGALRELSWELERTSVRLVVAPAITDVAGPRVVVRPVNGLPLLHVERPAFSGAQRLVKATVERLAALLCLLLLGPLMLAIAVIVRLTSPGPALFRQERIGQDGRAFSIYKFRTMRVDAEAQRQLIAHLNEHDGPLFKVRQDPRLTGIGRWLRRLSLDELPQLLNVVHGSMSLVGPRPPLPAEVESYGRDAHRRLLVKPGITGLWQVSGRSNLTWDESVRLDLYYVDNWSMTLDCILLWRTVFAVLSGRGAY